MKNLSSKLSFVVISIMFSSFAFGTSDSLCNSTHNPSCCYHEDGCGEDKNNQNITIEGICGILIKPHDIPALVTSYSKIPRSIFVSQFLDNDKKEDIKIILSLAIGQSVCVEAEVSTGAAEREESSELSITSITIKKEKVRTAADNIEEEGRGYPRQ